MNCAERGNRFKNGESIVALQSFLSPQWHIRVIPALLGSLVIEPVLLHGDLWVRQLSFCLPKWLIISFYKSGNMGTDIDSGRPVIFDPSSYFGHNEAE
jgi:protein-ribulosamine 3-kinase